MKDDSLSQDHGQEENTGTQTNIEDQNESIGDYLDPEVDTEALVQGLKSGQLTSAQQEALAGFLVEDEPTRHVTFQQKQTMYSGPLPHAEQFNAYDEDTRRIILQMAVDDQSHSHDMQKTGLTGAIDKDKRGQRYGLTIALAGFITAAIIAPFSPVVAGIIGALDIFGMVALFVAPRILEGRTSGQNENNKTPHE